MQTIVHPSYDDIFKFKCPPIEELLHNIPTIAIVNLVSFTNANLIYRESNFEIQNQLLLHWLSKVHPRVQNNIWNKINELGKDQNQTPLLFNSIGCLSLLQKGIEHYNDKKDGELNGEQQLNLFKAYLALLDEINKFVERNIELSKKYENKEGYLSVTLPHIIQQIEFNEPRDFISQSVKSTIFFKYIEQIEEYKIYFEKFLEENNVSSWHDYLKSIWTMYIPLVNNSKESQINKVAYVLRFGENDTQILHFMKNLIINDNIKEVQNNFENFNSFQKRDFKILREKPLFNFGKYHYSIFYHNFFIDKIFHSLVFSFLQIVKKAGQVDKDFKSKWSSDIIEKGIFHYILNYCFENNSTYKINGDAFKDIEYSDYYLRIDNKIFLFEFKDRIMDAKVKHSNDYDSIKKDIIEKYVNPSGAKQLIKVIEVINKGGFKFDSLLNMKLSNIEIYPLIIFTDYTYSADGVNYIVNEEFQNDLKCLSLEVNVKEIIMLNFDILVKYQEFLHDKDIGLDNLINKYILEKSIFYQEENYLKLFNEFSIYFRNCIKDLGVKPKIPKSFKFASRTILGHI